MSKKYQQIVDLINERIDKQSYQPGDKLPSIRDLSSQLALSKNTVIRAYQQLEASQRIEHIHDQVIWLPNVQIRVSQLSVNPAMST